MLTVLYYCENTSFCACLVDTPHLRGSVAATSLQMGGRATDRLKDDSFEKRGVAYGCLHILHYRAKTDSTTHTTAVVLDSLT